MALPTSKQIIRKYLKAMTHGKPGEISKYASADIRATQGAQTAQGHDALEAYAAHYRNTFEGWKFEVVRMIAEGSWVSVQARSTGKLRTAPKSPVIEIPWMAHYRISRGKVAEVDIVADASAMTSPEGKSAAPLVV